MFIEGRKFKELHDAAHNGDERAKEILHAYRCDDGNCSAMIEEYFAPKVEQPEVEVEGIEPERANMSKLERYLADNDITEESEDYQEYVDEFNKMFGEESPVVEDKKEEEKENPLLVIKLIEDEQEAIDGYYKYLNNLLASDLSEEIRAAINSTLTKIVEDEKQHIFLLKDLESKYLNGGTL